MQILTQKFCSSIKQISPLGFDFTNEKTFDLWPLHSAFLFFKPIFFYFVSINTSVLDRLQCQRSNAEWDLSCCCNNPPKFIK